VLAAAGHLARPHTPPTGMTDREAEVLFALRHNLAG
jgi:hypothetical protein